MKDVNILTNNGVNVQAGLELFGDMEMYDETLNDFLDMVAEKLTHLENYKTGDMPNYAIDVHSLKSDSRYLGFTTLADLSYESEMKSKAGDVNFVQENHPKIIAEAKRVISVAQQYLGREVVDLVPNIGGGNTVAPAPVTPTPVAPQATPVEVPAAQSVAVTPAPLPEETSTQPGEVTFEFSAPTQTPVSSAPQATPVSEPVAPAPVTTAPEVAPAQTAEPEIQFFSAGNYQPGDVMNNALYTMNQQASAPQVAPVKKGIILIIDDSNLVANFVKKIFSANYDVIIANDGLSGINIVNNAETRAKIKACLLDLNMPNMNGFDVMDYFYKNGIFVKTPVAVISGAEDQETIDKANSYPIIDILAKPFNDRDVQRVVEKCLAAYF